MHIGFDISQTGSGKAGCGYFPHAMIQSMLELAPEHQYSLFPSGAGVRLQRSEVLHYAVCEAFREQDYE